MSSTLFQRAIFKRTLLLTIIASSSIPGTQARTVQLGVAMKTYQVILLSCWGLTHSFKVETKCSSAIKTRISVFSYFQKTIKTTYLRFCLVLSDSLRPTDFLYPLRLLCPWDFPGKNTGVACWFLLQTIFPTQGLPPHLLHLLKWQTDFFYHWGTWEAQNYIFPRHKLEIQITFHVPWELWD